MTDSMKFGPEWLRNLSSDGTQNPPAPKYQLAEHRYGREEMLALFDRQVRAPDRVVGLQALYVEKTQPPLALVQMNEEETRMWNRGINSDAVLRLNGKPAPISIPGGGAAGRGGALVGGRGGSVDRGRGRARGQGSSYHYNRGLSYEEPGDAMVLDANGKPTYNRNIGRPYDRAQSMAGVERGWGERNGGEPQDWNGSTSPRKEFVRGLDNNWRRPRGAAGEDDEGWRTATASGSTKYVRPSSWREGDKEGGEVGGGGGGRWEGSRMHRGWDGDSHRHHMDPDNLPEWAMENPSESGGSFDATGAFHGGVHSEDDEDGGAGGEPARDHKPSDGSNKRRSPEDSKKTPPPAVVASHPPPSIAKSQSTPAISAANMAAAAKSSPAKTQQQQQHHLHSSQSNIVRMSPSETAFQIPLQMSTNNVDVNGDKVPQQAQFALNDPSILSTKFHHNSVGGFDPAVVAHFQMSAHNGNQHDGFVSRFVSPYGDPRGPRRNDEDLDRMQEDVDKLTADEEIHKMAAVKQSLIGQEDWFYRDPQSEVQGPFAAQEMDEWFRAGYFNVNLLIRRGCDERFSQLGDLIKTWGRVPFLPGPTMPPLKNELPTPPPTPSHPPPSKPPTMDPAEAAILQQQYQYQQLMQRQAQLGQHAAFQAILGKLGQSERWAALSPNEQQQLIMQQMVDPTVFLPQHQKPPLQQQYLPPPSKPAPDLPSAQHPLHQLIQQMGGQAPSPIGQPAGPIGHQGQMDQDPIQSLLRQINANSANSAKPQMDVWGNPLSAQSWMPPPVNHAATAPPPGQLPISLWDLQSKDMKTEQQIIDERMRAEEERRMEEAQKKEAEDKRRKKEDDLKRKEMEKQRLEQERLRQERQLEEARRKEEEEEKRILEEQKRLEDDIRKMEEKKRKEEEKKKREEEKRKKDEEKERKRKLEEDRKREEEEKKRQATLDEEESLRKRLEEEEQLRRLEQQHQALKRMEKAKAAPWSQQVAQQTAGSSLAEIQRQEKVQKERETREQQTMLQTMLLQQQSQQLQQQAAMLQAAADSKASSQLQLKWAERKQQAPASKVKSLSEIQAEEAKLSEREKAERALQQKDGTVPPSAGIWSAAPQSLTWASAAPVAWGGNSTPQGPVGFWDDVIPAPKPAPAPRPSPKPKASPANHSAAKAASPAPAKSQAAKTRNKKDEAVVMKLFDNQRVDDFTQWCYCTLQNLEAAPPVDIPTFVGFLRDIESPYEVRDYVKMYLGEGKEAQEFARQFLERRSKWRSAQRAAPQHDDLAQPAPAVNPSSTDFQEVKGKAKKVKKNKMFKVDNRILGFSVTAAQDRINVGDRDYGEGV